MAGLPTLPVNTLSYVAGNVNNFYWNRRWTFADARSLVWQRQLAYFAAIGLVGLLLNNTIMLFLDAPLAHLFGQSGFIPAKLLATAMVFLWSFSANRFWTFRSPH